MFFVRGKINPRQSISAFDHLLNVLLERGSIERIIKTLNPNTSQRSTAHAFLCRLTLGSLSGKQLKFGFVHISVASTLPPPLVGCKNHVGGVVSCVRGQSRAKTTP